MEFGGTTNNLPHSEFSGRCRLSVEGVRPVRKMASGSVRVQRHVVLLGTLLALASVCVPVQGQRPLGNSTFGAAYNSSGVINVHPVLTTSTTTSTESPRSVLPASASGFEESSVEEDSADLEHEHDEHDDHDDDHHHYHLEEHHGEGHGSGGLGSFPHPSGEMNAGASRNGGHDGAPIGSRQPGSRLINPYFPTPASTQGGSKTTEPQNGRQFNPARPGRGRKPSPITELHKMNKMSSTNMNGLDSGGEPISYGSTTHRRGQAVHYGGTNAYGHQTVGGRGRGSAAGGAGNGADGTTTGGGGRTMPQGGRGAADYGNRGRLEPGRGHGVIMQSPGYPIGSSSSYSRQGDDPLQRVRNRYNEERYHNSLPEQGSEMDDILGMKCNFETECAWTWEENNQHQGFQVVTGMNLTESNRTGLMPGPGADPAHNANGHFLHLRLTQESQPQILTSPVFGATKENCYLEVFTHQSAMHHGSIRIVIETIGNQESSWVPAEIMGNDLRRWQLNTFRIDRISKDFKVLFEVVPNKLGGQARGHVSIDNLRMVNCFPDSISTNNCSYSQVQCTSSKVPVCIKTPRICDITVDCDDNEDETLNCDQIPVGGRCDFETDWCGWQNYGNVILSWARHSGPTPTEKTGPDMDHTHENTNVTGYYMFVNMNQHANDSEKKTLVGLASNAIMNSVTFNPPPLVHTNASSPYRNSCVVRFYVHQYGMNPGSINLSSVEIREKENFTTTLWWSSKNLGEDWVRVDIILPNITTKYYLQFEARMGMRIYSDVAIDDFSLSPECFGLNIPAEHLQGYNYYNPRIGGAKQPHKDFVGKSFLELNTCGAKGQQGPTPADCLTSYNNTEAFSAVHVIDSHPFKGIQAWKVPNEGYYTIIAKGAGGGLGSGGVGSSRGAMVLSVLELHKDEEIYILVGQSGEHACIKSMGSRDESCETRNKQLNMDPSRMHSKTQQVKNTIIEEGAGGGGGGTYVFLLNSANTAVPLLVAGGGGGLGVGRYLDDDIQHGKKYLSYKKDVSGTAHGESTRQAGPGGGWRAQADMGLDPHFGASLLEGGRGGLPCYTPRGTHGQGGFGGGGGGCDTGGGGGGYSGGDTMINSTNGEGGSSFMASKRNVPELSMEFAGENGGHGAVLIIPAIQGCGCDYRCVALDEYRATVGCICPDGWTLKPDNYTACECSLCFVPVPTEAVEMKYLIMFFVVVVLVLCAALASLILILYNRYQRKRQAALRHKMLLEQDLQLSRLRSTADDSALTNFNPNYGCDGILNGNVDVKSLPQVARESLRLVKFIVLELLAGGDLKNFLREGRNKPVPNSSDYLIPLPGPRSVAERLLSEATGVTIPDTLMTCTPPKNASPRIVNGHTVVVSNALVGHGGPQQPPLTTVTDGACWETSFIRKHPGQACQAGGVPLPPPPVLDPAEAVLPPNGPSMVPPVPEVADKLISLDTPQQTPTAIQPPISFSNPVNGEFGDGASSNATNGVPMTNGNGHSHNGPPIVESPIETAKLLSSIPPPITLDPAALSMQQNHVVGTSYANIRMMNSANGNGSSHNHSNGNNNNHGDHGVIGDKLSGTGGMVITYCNGPTGNGGVNSTGVGGNNGGHSNTNGHHSHGHGGNGGGNGGSDKSSNGSGQDPSRQANAPFTIQTFSERYISPENHSEISC
uniref:receptor protein-tyrosine kinase n=1 Tax=Anopheles epiroticus TaxID=199890 RepID=A0A182P1D0_9DIPT